MATKAARLRKGAFAVATLCTVSKDRKLVVESGAVRAATHVSMGNAWEAARVMLVGNQSSL